MGDGENMENRTRRSSDNARSKSRSLDSSAKGAPPEKKSAPAKNADSACSAPRRTAASVTPLYPTEDERNERSIRKRDGASMQRLKEVIDLEIMPILNKARSLEQRPATPVAIDDTDIGRFLDVLLRRDYDQTVVFLEELRQRPVPLGVLFLDVMTPTARKLGEMWANDECSFVEVTVGVSHLQRLTRDFSPLYQSDIPKSRHAGRILLAAVSGEQHTFGLSLLCEVFRRAGWEVTETPAHSHADFTQLMAAQAYDIVGFSLSCVDHADVLKNDISFITSCFGDNNTKVIVGGPAFLEDATLLETLNVDGFAENANEAVILAEMLLRPSASLSS